MTPKRALHGYETIRLLQLNVSSIKSKTYQHIGEAGAHIVTLQETRKEIRTTNKYRCINKLRVTKQGGGVAIGIHNSLKSQEITNLYEGENEVLIARVAS